MKACAQCQLEKPETDYSSATRGPGTRNTCKKCSATAAQVRRENKARGILGPRQQLYAERDALLALGKLKCRGCGEVSNIEEHSINAREITGRSPFCAGCIAKKNKAYWQSLTEGDREERRSNYIPVCERSLEEQMRLRQRRKEIKNQNIEEHRLRRRESETARAEADLEFRIHRSLRSLIRQGASRAGAKKSHRTIEHLGCSFTEFRQHIESLFALGMTWENYGSLWEYGHRKPRAAFDVSDKTQCLECYHHSNLFPQLKTENRSVQALYEGIDFKGLKAANYIVRPIDLECARELVEAYHYAGTAPSAATVCYGLFRKEVSTVPIGASIFRPAPLGAARSQCPEDPQTVLCLSRLVLLPDLPKNTASYFLSRCLRLLKVENRWRCVVSYADTWQEHTGAIYKASNWEDLGLTQPQPVWTLNGQLIGKRRGKKSLTDADLRALGAQFHGSFPKHLFRYRLC